MPILNPNFSLRLALNSIGSVGKCLSLGLSLGNLACTEPKHKPEYKANPKPKPQPKPNHKPKLQRPKLSMMLRSNLSRLRSVSLGLGPTLGIGFDIGLHLGSSSKEA